MPRLALVLLVALAACGGGGHAGDDAAPIDTPTTPIDATHPDAMPADADHSACDWRCQNPVDDGCVTGASEICGNGLDDDCDGQVDEGCHCPAGAVQSCFRGHPGLRNVGACVDGSQTCQGSGSSSAWGPCEGGIAPTAEACDSVDNDCNGCADDSPACCVVTLACPAPGTLPDGSPFHAYQLDGTQFYAGQVDAWSWTITGGPCDQMFASEGKPVTFALTNPTTATPLFTPTLSGDYTVTVTMTLPGGAQSSCTFVVHVGAPGVRVELCWDNTGVSDLDLHLHRSGTTTNWFYTTGTTVNPDDCDYQDCKNQMGLPTIANWGYPNTPTAGCPGGWPATGCTNPRLDIDNINTVGVPENINVDDPIDGDTFRAFVHYYGASTTPTLTHPLVNIYCGGQLQATFGAAPDLVDGFTAPGTLGGAPTGPMWRVADITAHVTNGVTTGCTLTQLHPPAQTTGYWVANDGVITY